jgi:hypothetical protein
MAPSPPRTCIAARTATSTWPSTSPPPERLHATAGGACLLDPAAELQQALAERTGETVSVDLGRAALERATEA